MGKGVGGGGNGGGRSIDRVIVEWTSIGAAKNPDANSSRSQEVVG